MRRRSDLVRVLVSSVSGIAHATCAAQRLANERINVAGGLGRTFMHLAAFEAATAHPLEAEEAEKFGNGCQGLCTSAREEMSPAVAASKVLVIGRAAHSAALSARLCVCEPGQRPRRSACCLRDLIERFGKRFEWRCWECRSWRSRHACFVGR